ncbi:MULTISPECIES: glycosyltransferase [unclassified Arthrobacter]|uniref:glycosyltransferase n=1 Tax=unclassified Arthrobacter TaxID=235627 RepID=UPI002E07FC13|nr:MULTISPECIES: glycosyltransferase [unclassified Arthrobacter]MEC5189766.1 glycosyltransferase involved in cell wall biosynthesis [Arthrobacter sp. MP_M4]MEC5201233.1 glycosyltransferase involved in cell wall biosynthesis [Arthrobacter sp. MP_M7]
MKLLYITESVPNRDPVFGDGSSMIPYEILRNLPAEVDVILLTFAGPVELPDEVRGRCAEVHVLAPRSRRSALALSVGGLNGVGKHERSTAEALVAAARLSAQCDATLIHGPHALFLARQVQGPLVLQTVDPWSIRAGMDTAIAGRLRPAYKARERLALQAERRLPGRARLLTVGAQDAVEWSRRLARPVRSIPNGAEQALRPAVRGSGPVVCFVGSLNYGPNIDSAKVLVGTIAPLVWEKVPDARFVLAGRRPEPEVLSLAGPRVEVLANVPSVLEVFQSADVAAFPDEHGVGIRNSVREALASGLPVVATPVAAREQDPHPLLTIEEDSASFADHVINRLTGPRPEDTERTAGEVRTWQVCTQEYLDELRNAIRSGNAGLPLGSSPA